jgi:UDP:flavonoid glycosyltransferase YjiC (YdhE family)
MSRVLLAWELGLNRGHLTRLLAVAEQLKSDGHSILVASRDVQAAAAVLGPAGISFIQAPHLTNGIPLRQRASGYADILLSQGWSDVSTLWGLVQAWLNLIRMCDPDLVILDYSPTANLAVRIAELPSALVGNGFEIPPASNPLPCFPGFPWATQDKAEQAERLIVQNANRVLASFHGKPIEALRDLIGGQRRLLASFPELDHYGPRADVEYIGPLLGETRVAKIEWPDGKGPKIFTSVRPDTARVELILSGLAKVAARVICVATGFPRERLKPFMTGSVRFASGPVALEILSDADLCFTYGAEGTMLSFLLAGVPQLISPWHVETYMGARRIAEHGLGEFYEGTGGVQGLEETIYRLVANVAMTRRVRDFSDRARAVYAKQAAALRALTVLCGKEQVREAVRIRHATVA